MYIVGINDPPALGSLMAPSPISSGKGMWGGPPRAEGEGAKDWEIPGVAEILFQAFLPSVSPSLHPPQLPPRRSGTTRPSRPSHHPLV